MWAVGQPFGRPHWFVTSDGIARSACHRVTVTTADLNVYTVTRSQNWCVDCRRRVPKDARTGQG
jgi:hypothetical protein